MEWHWMDGWGWAAMAFGIVFWLALLGLVVWGISEWTRRRERVDGREPPRGESPREILDTRLASGEIDIETYERALEALARRHEPGAGVSR